MAHRVQLVLECLVQLTDRSYFVTSSEAQIYTNITLFNDVITTYLNSVIHSCVFVLYFYSLVSLLCF